MRLISWQWDLMLFPKNIEQTQEGVLSVMRTFFRKMLLSGRKNASFAAPQISPADPSKPGDFLRIVNEAGENGFRLEVHEDRLTYQHKIPGAWSLLDHLNVVAAPLLKALRSDIEKLELENRALRVGIAFNGRIDVPRDQPGSDIKRNSDFLRRNIMPGLDPSRAMEFDGLRKLLGRGKETTLGRVDLKFSLAMKLLGKQADVWFDLQCPANEDYSFLDVNTTVQNAEGSLPSMDWAMDVVKMYEEFYRPVIEESFLKVVEKGKTTHKKSGRSRGGARD